MELFSYWWCLSSDIFKHAAAKKSNVKIFKYDSFIFIAFGVLFAYSRKYRKSFSIAVKLKDEFEQCYDFYNTSSRCKSKENITGCHAMDIFGKKDVSVVYEPRKKNETEAFSDHGRLSLEFHYSACKLSMYYFLLNYLITFTRDITQYRIWILPLRGNNQSPSWTYEQRQWRTQKITGGRPKLLHSCVTSQRAFALISGSTTILGWSWVMPTENFARSRLKIGLFLHSRNKLLNYNTNSVKLKLRRRLDLAIGESLNYNILIIKASIVAVFIH